MSTTPPGDEGDLQLERSRRIFNAPPAVTALLGILIAVHGVRALLPEETGAWLLLAMAFIPARYSGLGEAFPGGELAVYTSPLTHMLVHGDAIHLALNSAWLLALGGVVAQRIGSVRFIALCVTSGIAGALAFALVNFGLLAPMIGASGAISGLMGAAMRFLLAGAHRGEHAAEAARRPLVPLLQALNDRNVIMATLVFLALNLLAGLGFGLDAESAGIAWEAHLGGYFAGLLSFGVFDAPQQRISQLPKDNIE